MHILLYQYKFECVARLTHRFHFGTLASPSSDPATAFVLLAWLSLSKLLPEAILPPPPPPLAVADVDMRADNAILLVSASSISASSSIIDKGV